MAALGALTGNQAVQQVSAGLKAIYISGWQVAADNVMRGRCYPRSKFISAAKYVPGIWCAALTRALVRARIKFTIPEGKNGVSNGSPQWLPTPKRALAEI